MTRKWNKGSKFTPSGASILSLPYLSYFPAGIFSPGFHVGTSMLCVKYGSDGVMVCVSDMSHVIVYGWCAIIPLVNSGKFPVIVKFAVVAVIVVGVLSLKVR